MVLRKTKAFCFLRPANTVAADSETARKYDGLKEIFLEAADLR